MLRDLLESHATNTVLGLSHTTVYHCYLQASAMIWEAPQCSWTVGKEHVLCRVGSCSSWCEYCQPPWLYLSVLVSHFPSWWPPSVYPCLICLGGKENPGCCQVTRHSGVRECQNWKERFLWLLFSAITLPQGHSVLFMEKHTFWDARQAPYCPNGYPALEHSGLEILS